MAPNSTPERTSAGPIRRSRRWISIASTTTAMPKRTARKANTESAVTVSLAAR
jgi:hypothetical protein